MSDTDNYSSGIDRKKSVGERDAEMYVRNARDLLHVSEDDSIPGFGVAVAVVALLAAAMLALRRQH